MGFLGKSYFGKIQQGLFYVFFRKPISNFGSYNSLVNFVLHVL